MTVTDCFDTGHDAARRAGPRRRLEGEHRAVRLSFDVDCRDAAFVAGASRPEPGGFLPRAVREPIQVAAERPWAGIEIVECSAPYDKAEIPSLIGTQVTCDMLGRVVDAGHLPRSGR